MAQHLRGYDEGWDRGDERDRRSRDEDRERSWRDSERDRNERNLSFMLGDRDRSWEREANRGRGDYGMSHYGPEHGYGGFQGDFSRSGREQGGFGGRGDWERSARNFSSHQDDHYRSWRDKQVDALDRDYADYCREREQQFHQDFDTWRRRRHGNPQPLQTGMTQSGVSADPTGTLELTGDAAVRAENGPDPIATATLGTTSGRGR